MVSCYSTDKSNEEVHRKPNVVLILVDDLGWADVGFMGNPVYETPNLDKLSNESLVFNNAYAPAANCAPSRACIITGKQTPSHGIFTVGSSERGNVNDRKLIPVPNTTTLDSSFITIAEALKQKEYVSASVGKWHLGEDPQSQGFDYNIAGSHEGHPKSYFSPYKNEHLEDGEKGEYLTDRLTNEAIHFMESQKEHPFFLYLPYYTVHTPLQGKADIVEKYRKKINGDSRFNATYGAMVESMDSNVGRLLSTIETLGLSDNTIVIFTSDNGGLASVSSQFPLRGGKGSYYEGGIRVPLLIKWPEKIKTFRKVETPVSGLDIFPTLLDIVNDTTSHKTDGVSLLPILEGKKSTPERALVWHFPIYLQSVNPLKEEARDSLFRTRPGSVIRKGKWKLHEYFEEGDLELYDLEKDLREQKNVYTDHPEIAEALYRELQQWRRDHNAPMPKKKNPYYAAK
ncbi:sulfatase [Snuella lapsa]|uniref:Sulfatase n=2 Tax=Snuella lapsa TaxID=870481 RepID=A0ABP6X7Z3_9FLAO